MMKDMEAVAARKAGVIYVGISLLIAVLFLGAALLTGNYGAIALVGGAVWVFILTMIVTMPIVIPAVKKKVMG